MLDGGRTAEGTRKQVCQMSQMGSIVATESIDQSCVELLNVKISNYLDWFSHQPTYPLRFMGEFPIDFAEFPEISPGATWNWGAGPPNIIFLWIE